MITLTPDTKGFDRKLRTQRKRGQDMSAAFAEIREIILSAIEENFEQEGRYASPESAIGGSTKWKDLKESTKRQRTKKGKWPGKILQVSQGGLAASISGEHGKDYAAAGSNKVYAARQHFGWPPGSGDITPARPFMHVQAEDLEEAEQTLLDHLTDVEQ